MEAKTPVMIELTVTMIYDWPSDTIDQDSISYLENGLCRDNLIDQLKDEQKEYHCNICHRSAVKFVRVATSEDIAQFSD
jgi:hypothetical protein